MAGEDRSYLSIGEVLSLLKAEFPDVTISKIRFLESQGLLDPERTPSGYRKFYDGDVERLRWILRQQREHFLPLKVIKGRLRSAHDDHAGNAGVVEIQPVGLAGSAAGTASRGSGEVGPSGSGLAAPAVPVAPRASISPAAAAGAPMVVAAAAAPSRSVVTAREEPAAAATPSAQSGVSMTLAELVGASGLAEDDLRDLERFGLISGRRVASSVYYDEDALGVAHLAAGFMKYGVEARHLRMYKTAGEREAGFFEQVVMPMLKQRNPQARRQAVEALEELTRLGQGLRAAMLSQALRPHVEGS
jgi:DNA-binding transcriptional MerR regulator